MLNRPLLLHSKNGHGLLSSQITRSVKAVLKRIDPEFVNVSTMMLRSSFATMMFESFNRGEVMKDKTEEQFQNGVAKYMNTSLEQLRATYVNVGSRTFTELARDISRLLPVPDEHDSDLEQ